MEEAYLVDADEEKAIGKNRPHENVGKDSGDEAILVRNHDGTIPVNSHESPCQGTRHHGGVDESRVCMVAEGHGRQVDEVDDENELSPDEVAAGKEHHEGEVKQVVEDEVRPASGRSIHLCNIAREEVQDVAKLQDEQDNAGSPGQRSGVPKST